MGGMIPGLKYPCNPCRKIHSLKNIQMDIHGSWIYHRHMDTHLYIFNKCIIRHGYCMDTSTRVVVLSFEVLSKCVLKSLFKKNEIYTYSKKVVKAYYSYRR